MKSRVQMSALLALLLMVTGCVSTPTIKSQLPDRPVTLLAPINAPPAPRPLTGLPEQEQAKILIQEYVEALRWGGELDRVLDELQAWVLRLYEAEEPRDGK